eukprot:789731-Pyramimonas_sp.AAC.1
MEGSLRSGRRIFSQRAIFCLASGPGILADRSGSNNAAGRWDPGLWSRLDLRCCIFPLTLDLRVLRTAGRTEGRKD